MAGIIASMHLFTAEHEVLVAAATFQLRKQK